MSHYGSFQNVPCCASQKLDIYPISKVYRHGMTTRILEYKVQVQRIVLHTLELETAVVVVNLGGMSADLESETLEN